MLIFPRLFELELKKEKSAALLAQILVPFAQLYEEHICEEPQRESSSGNDLYIQYGDEFGLPLLANFDPPVAPGAGTSGSFLSSNPKDPLDVNNDGFVTPIDALLVINEINAHGSHVLDINGFHTAPFIDTDTDNIVSPHDVLLVINRLNAPSAGSLGAEGEASDLSPAAAHDMLFSQLGGATAPAVSDATVDAGIFSLLADDQIRAKRSRQGE